MKLKFFLIDLICTALVVLFVYAAVTKLVVYEKTKMQMSQSPFITDNAGVIAWAVPAFELVISILLIVNVTRLIGLYASLFIMTLFTVYIYAMLHFSSYIPCSCGGILNRMNWTQHFWFNILFVLLSIIGIVLKLKSKSPEMNKKKEFNVYT